MKLKYLSFLHTCRWW